MGARLCAVILAAVPVVLLATPALGQTAPSSDERIATQLEEMRRDHEALRSEIQRAADERLRNAERLTRLEAFAEENTRLNNQTAGELTDTRSRVRQLADQISALATNLLMGALATVGVLMTMLASQRVNRRELRKARRELRNTDARVQYVAKVVNGVGGAEKIEEGV